MTVSGLSVCPSRCPQLRSGRLGSHNARVMAFSVAGNRKQVTEFIRAERKSFSSPRLKCNNRQIQLFRCAMDASYGDMANDSAGSQKRDSTRRVGRVYDSTCRNVSRNAQSRKSVESEWSRSRNVESVESTTLPDARILTGSNDPFQKNRKFHLYFGFDSNPKACALTLRAFFSSALPLSKLLSAAIVVASERCRRRSFFFDSSTAPSASHLLLLQSSSSPSPSERCHQRCLLVSFSFSVLFSVLFLPFYGFFSLFSVLVFNFCWCLLVLCCEFSELCFALEKWLQLGLEMVVQQRLLLMLLQKVPILRKRHQEMLLDRRQILDGSMDFQLKGIKKKIKCRYCDKIFPGVYRLKHHLAGTSKDAGPCIAVPEDIRKQMYAICFQLQANLVKKTQVYEREISTNVAAGDIEAAKRKREEGEQSQVEVDFKKRGVSSQTTMVDYCKKGAKEQAYLDIAEFFYNNAISFNVARTEEYHKMLGSVACHGRGFIPPSYHQLRVTLLKQKVQETNQELEAHKAYWKKTGCTIMTDGWTDRRRRTILNFLVNSPKGTVFLKSINASHITKTADKIFKMMDDVVEEVGEENVVQVVTDNAANYKAAGEMLMQKRKHLYWTPCAAHCIDLMLEDFEKKIPIHKKTIGIGKKITTCIYGRTSLISLLQHHTNGKDLVRPAVTRFATSYLTLDCLNENKDALMRMFTSKEWKSTQFAKTKDGRNLESMVMDREFWKNIVICLKGACPLIHVLRLVDSDEKPAMGFIYEAMDGAKEKIQEAFKGVQKSYKPLWDIIDERWNNQLHRPLHAAGYFLNPRLHYSKEFKADYEVKRGLNDCMARMVGNDDELRKVDAQLEDFKMQKGEFGSRQAIVSLDTKTPQQWWDSYGFEHSELTRFANRVLGLTCSSSGCERNWSAFERVHTKRRNRLKQKTMNDVVFVMANSKLYKKTQVRKPHEYSIDDLSSDDEWIVETDGGNAQGMNVDLRVEGQQDLGLQVGEGSSVGGGTTRVDDNLDFVIPSVDDEEIDEDEDYVDDDYFDLNANEILDD